MPLCTRSASPIDSTRLLRSATFASVAATLLLQATGRFIGPSLVVLAVVQLVGLALLRRRPRPAAATIGITTAAGLVLHLGLILTPLTRPELGLTFMTTLAAVLANVAVLAAAPLVMLSRTAVSASRWTVRLALVGLALGVLTGSVLYTTRPQQPPQPGDLVLVTSGTDIYPDALAAPAGVVTVAVRNDDPLSARSFDIDELGVHVLVPAATWRRIQFVAPSGRYRFHDEVTFTDATSGDLLVGVSD
jgi:lysylphosphatidylglycerol synthetase-like protein (DUF2156 family)